MIYLDHIVFPDEDAEWAFHMGQVRTCYDSYYPYGVLTKIGFRRIDFEDVTILCGGNGTGKSTVLNVIAEAIGARRETLYNRTPFFGEYVASCEWEFADDSFQENCVISSDSVFDRILDVRTINEGVDEKRGEVFSEYLDLKYNSSGFRVESMADIDKLRKINQARSKTQSKYVRNNLAPNIREYSNGESAFGYFAGKIEPDSLYILDEPENSLSPQKQMELRKLIEDCAWYCNCQFIISTHSPFISSIRNAKIYDLNENPVDVKRWEELKDIKLYRSLFE